MTNSVYTLFTLYTGKVFTELSFIIIIIIIIISIITILTVLHLAFQFILVFYINIFCGKTYMSICLGKDRVSFEFSSIYFNILNFLLLGFVITFAEHLFCFFTWILECIPGRIMSLKHLSWFLFFLALLPAVLYLARKGPWYILKPSALRRRFSSLVRLLRWKQSKMVEDGWLFLRESLS